jgi:hypothetical protein
MFAGCSGGGETAQPPPATHEQAQLIASAPFQAPDAGGSAISGTPQDMGTLLPLDSLRPRSVSGITTMSISGCSLTTACIGGTNSSTGPGVSGVSSLGKGVTGTTTFASTTSTNGQYGLYGQDSSASGTFDVGVYGLSVRGIGTSGKSTSNYGVRGTSSSSYGVAGISTQFIGVWGSGPQRGVWGSGGTIGVYGNGTTYAVEGNTTSTSGTGVYGTSTNYIGVEGNGPAYIGVYALGKSYANFGFSSAGLGGLFESSTNRGLEGYSDSATGVYAQSQTGDALEAHTGGGLGAYVTNTNGNGADVTGTYIGLVARANSFPLVATNSAGSNLFYVDGNGNVFYHGSLSHFASTVTGAEASVYSPESTRPAIEDTGTARLVDGHATVALDPTFAATIDTQRPYQVFLTPGGDTRGLYVASKTSSQFVVREVQGGRGTFSFDYHIYGTALGKAAEHMRIVQPNARALPRPQREALPQIIKPKE